jgi:hypothetical protein
MLYAWTALIDQWQLDVEKLYIPFWAARPGRFAELQTIKTPLTDGYCSAFSAAQSKYKVDACGRFGTSSGYALSALPSAP